MIDGQTKRNETMKFWQMWEAEEIGIWALDRAGGYIRQGSPGKGSQITGGVRKGKKTLLLISEVDLKIANFN
jgi:hypothetical protein